MVTVNQLLYKDDDISGIATAFTTTRSYLITDEWSRILEDADNLQHNLSRPVVNKRNLRHNAERVKALQRNDAYRRRRKAEMGALQQEVVVLSKILAKMKQRKSQQNSRGGAQDVLAVGVWKAIAMRQYDKRLESEVLQKLLRSAVSSRTGVIQSLQNTLRKKLREDDTEAVERSLGELSSLNMNDAMLYAAHFDSLSVLYSKLDEVFDGLRVNSMPGNVFVGEPARKMDGEEYEYLEKIWAGRVPFSFQTTCDAVRKLASAPHRQDSRCQYDGLNDSENSMAVQYCIPFLKGSASLKIRSYQVARRYVEESRMVVVWRVLSDANTAFPGMNMDETGWCIVHSPTSYSDPAKTFVQACIRFTPMHVGVGGCGGDAVEMVHQFTEMTMEVGVDDTLEIEHVIESLVLDEALRADALQLDEADMLPSTEFLVAL